MRYFCVMVQKTALVILDGWGIGRHDGTDAIWMANTPFTDSLYNRVPHSMLRTDGENVGLPTGQMGNSEVGHMNIGAGRIVWQMLVRINKAFADGEIRSNPVLQDALEKAKAAGRSLHLMGLLSQGGVHSHRDHLIGLCAEAAAAGVENIYIHAFTDGRDTDPKCGDDEVRYLLENVGAYRAKLSTVIGRYFAMDRDNRWERVAQAYRLMVHGEGIPVSDAAGKMQEMYNEGVTDEFMHGLRCLEGEEGLIKDGDVVLCFNFRTDRGRQISRALSQEDYPDQGMKKLAIEYYTLTEYDETFKISGVFFEKQNLKRTLGEVVSAAGATQLRAAETEKYPHVTFFFSGGEESPFPGEERLLVNSPKVATYDLQPEMSAPELQVGAVHFMKEKMPDFICLNFANADMVGHTGVFPAIVKAVETVDLSLQNLVTEGLQLGYKFLVIADHGNADMAINPDGSPNTAHTLNPVPCWLIGAEDGVKLRDGILADVAPTILELMGIDKPEEMTGRSLISRP